ncbi:hypothetical protein MZO42_00200 [Sphingomonas psychrotolerans]|uniref:Uncharacterized protein n=1 Tax=Sphingomonas psychrotolerans TaxID=1327635 RepID=A0ABU3MYR5_9SPHN|nr:hypothetical protein [Sphingomonas psychrotolerans]MDT8757106.1 hypothetical protein [Sphingomonas psychrotolerans]
MRRGPGAERSSGNTSTWSDGSVAMLVALLIATGPLLTIAGAKLLSARQRAAAAKLEGEAAPRIAAARNATEAHQQLDGVLRRRALGPTMEALARALPQDAVLVRAARTSEGIVEIEVEVADPDKLRAALRRSPTFARLRNTGQRQADARMIVTFAGTAP